MATVSYRQVLRLPQVAELLACACLSRLADRMFMLAIVLYALQRFGSPALTGWVAFAAFVPSLIASPPQVRSWIGCVRRSPLLWICW
jgi:hypothetical protein